VETIKGLGFYSYPQKSPIILIGLFCLLCLVSGCLKETDPKDVTIMFWIALSENKWNEAKKYSLEGSETLFDKKQHNISLQVGKVEINYNEATVKTFIIRETAASGSSFKTYLVRVKKTDIWKVDYAKTLDNINDKEFKNVFKALKKLGSDAKKTAKEKIHPLKDKGKSTLENVKNWLKKQFKKVLD
jgi:hypothetical protein